MKKELEDKLYNENPILFQEKDLPASETCMCWGISCGDGWFDILNRLCEIMTFNMINNWRHYPLVKFIQVKEKLGGLRVYYRTYPLTEAEVKFKDKDLSYEEYLDNLDYGYFSGLVSFAESLSYSICEFCGTNQDVTQTNGWIVTLCPKCKEEYLKDHPDLKECN